MKFIWVQCASEHKIKGARSSTQDDRYSEQYQSTEPCFKYGFKRSRPWPYIQWLKRSRPYLLATSSALGPFSSQSSISSLRSTCLFPSGPDQEVIWSSLLRRRSSLWPWWMMRMMTIVGARRWQDKTRWFLRFLFFWHSATSPRRNWWLIWWWQR